jgi:hypothetical protein
MPSSSRITRFSLLLVVPLVLTGCNALNPFCGSARPAPRLTSISPTSVDLSQLPSPFVITAIGTHFVSSSDVVFNGDTFAAVVVSSTQLTVTLPSSAVPTAGSFNFEVRTPAGNSGAVGCSSGGTSSAQVLTVN